MRVRLTATELVYHGMFRNRRVRWSGVASVAVELVRGGNAGACAPTLRLADGGVWPLRQLAGYSTTQRVLHSRMERQVDEMAARLPGG
jgi:hypothetical protein